MTEAGSGVGLSCAATTVVIVAMVMIYALLAIPFRSYVQPFIVMCAIPFGLIGAVLGHLIMGAELTILSMFGVVALTGVVVNDSLVMVDFVNRNREKYDNLLDAVRISGIQRSAGTDANATQSRNLRIASTLRRAAVSAREKVKVKTAPQKAKIPAANPFEF